MKKLLKRIILFLPVLYFCIQPLQAQTLPTVSFASSSSAHGESYSPTIPIEVDLSNAYEDTVYVDYAVTGGTATNGGVDYLLSPGMLTFSPGETKKYITIYMVHDYYGETNETIIITLSNPENATLGTPSSHTYTIINDDWNVFDFLQSNVSGSESVTDVTLTVGYFRLINVGDVSVNYQVIGGTATGGGVDYILNSGTLKMPLGQDTNDIHITVINDSLTEPDETIIVKLISGEPNNIGLRSTCTYTILNDDDNIAPAVSGYYPEPNSIQVPLDTFIKLEITDNLSGVDVNTVQILVENNIVYDGSLAEPNGVYNSLMGTCRRIGTPTDYSFIFLPSSWFDYEQEVDVVAYAKDKLGNTMPKKSYSFYTVMRGFGNNLKVNTGGDSQDQDHSSAATDSSGNIWVVWDHTNSLTDADIYIGKLKEGSNSFGTSTVVCRDAGIQNYPVIAIDHDNNIYVAWQGQSTLQGKWSIYVSKSADGITWSTPTVVDFSDPGNDYSQNLPAIAIDRSTTDTIYIVCEDNRGGNQDIWLSSSTDGTSWSPKRLTTNTSAQTDPDIAIKSHVVYVGWIDARNASKDIYGAISSNVWANQLWVGTSSYQTSVSIAADSINGALQEFWVDDVSGYYDIFYREEGSSSTGVSVTDEAGVGKSRPSGGIGIINGQSVPFVAWRDWRNVLNNNDTDIYYAEKTSSGFGTNILINDDIGTSAQSNPAVGVSLLGSPYIVWTDGRNGNNDIYYSGMTSFSAPYSQKYLVYGNSIIIQTTNGIEISIPSGSLPSGFAYSDIAISKLLNPPSLPEGCFGISYDFSPSGLIFSNSVTITIPHSGDDCPHQENYSVYWYNTQTGTWSQDGISDVEHYEISATFHTISFKTTHLTSFIVSASGASSSDGGSDSGSGSGGGCAMSRYSQTPEEISGYFVPYAAYIMILLLIGWRDKRNRIHNEN